MKTTTGLTLEVAPDGGRVWAYQPGAPGFAGVEFSTLHPVSLIAERAVSSCVRHSGCVSGARNAIALHFGDGYSGRHRGDGGGCAGAIDGDGAVF